MKCSILSMMLWVFMIGSATSCDKSDAIVNTENNGENNMENGKIKIRVNAQVFTATLAGNTAAKEFKEMLPLTITMVELNGNEKYYDLSKSLPAKASNPGTIQNGDLMLYGSRTLVLFYKTFSTSYNYTKLGRIDDTQALAAALGTGNVTLTFAKE